MGGADQWTHFSCHATLPQRVLIMMKPYNERAKMLVPIYGKDNGVMISIGKDYQLEKQSRANKQKLLDVVVWDTVDAKYMLQMNYLSTGIMPGWIMLD